MKRSRIIPILFIAMLAAGMLLIFIMPKNKISDEENRTLARMPKFNAENLFSGEYTLGINSYLNDHFPFRTKFIAMGDGARNLMTFRSEDSIEVYAGVGNEDMGVGENLYSTEAEPPEQEPEQEETPPEAAYIEVAEEADYNRSGIIISGTRAMELFGYYENMLANYAAKVNALYDAAPGVNVYSIVVPTAVEFYSPVKYHTGMRSQKDALTTLYSMMYDDIKKVDAYTYIAAKADQYVYFRTDHHWTARGAYQGYYAFCKAAGLEPVELESFDTEVVSYEFVGSLYRYTKSQIIKDNPDYVEVFYQPMVESSMAYYSTEMTGAYEAQVVSNPVSTTNKYLAFLGGDHPLMHIVTTNKNGQRLLIFKDSFGNALTPFLTNHFEEIYVVDPRSASLAVSEFCAKHGITDMLVENYAFAISNGEILKGLTKAAR